MNPLTPLLHDPTTYLYTIIAALYLFIAGLVLVTLLAEAKLMRPLYSSAINLGLAWGALHTLLAWTANALPVTVVFIGAIALLALGGMIHVRRLQLRLQQRRQKIK